MNSGNSERPTPPEAEISRPDRPRPAAAAPAGPLPPLPSHSLFRPDREDEEDLPPPGADCSGDQPHDGEDDHSMTEFDLNGETGIGFGKDQFAAAASRGSRRQTASALDEDYFPEDECSPMEEESDSSTADFDLNAEIEARLGKAPPLSPAEPGSVPDPRPAGADPSAPLEQYFPEDERSSPDWEDDHSMTPFDPDEEVERRLGGAPPAPSAFRSPDAPEAAARDSDYYPEDERSTMDWEDDHSGADLDLTPGGAAGIGRNPDNGPESGQGHERTGGPDAATPDEACMHPGLAASLSASLAYARSASAAGSEQKAPDAGAPSPAAPAPLPPAAVRHEEDDDDDGNEEEEDEEDGPGRPMSLRDHLAELRRRIGRAFLCALAGFALCYPFAQDLFKLLLTPLTKVLPSAGHLIYTSPPEAFFIYMKVAFVAGLFITSPLVFYQLWAFVAPGLYKEEKVHILPIAFFSALFFICGGAFCYFITFPFAFEFFMSYSTDVIVAMPALGETLDFVLQLLLAFGLIFELPLFVFFLARLGLLTAGMMRKFRRYAVLANVIVAAILTPPDVMSQLLMAGPLLLLYEFSILIAALVGREKKETAPDDSDETDDDDDREEKDDAVRA